MSVNAATMATANALKRSSSVVRLRLDAFNLKTLLGKPLNPSHYENKVVLIVNVASM